MSESVTVRPMRPGEESEVCSLVARVFDALVAPDFPPEGVEEFYRYAETNAMVARVAEGAIVLVAEIRDRIVGMIELIGSTHIAMLFVESRGEGIGRSLVEAVLGICRGHAKTGDRVTVHASRYAAPIYRRLGFEAEGPERTENGITYVPMGYGLSSGKS